MTIAFIVLLVVAVVLYAAAVLLSYGIVVDRSAGSWSYSPGGHEFDFPVETVDISIGRLYIELYYERGLGADREDFGV